MVKEVKERVFFFLTNTSPHGGRKEWDLRLDVLNSTGKAAQEVHTTPEKTTGFSLVQMTTGQYEKFCENNKPLLFTATTKPQRLTSGPAHFCVHAGTKFVQVNFSNFSGECSELCLE